MPKYSELSQHQKNDIHCLGVYISMMRDLFHNHIVLKMTSGNQDMIEISQLVKDLKYYKEKLDDAIKEVEKFAK